MKPTESMPNDSRKELEDLRARAKAGDSAAQIEIVEKLLPGIRRGAITPREGHGDAFRWVRTAEINPDLTDGQRVELAETILRHQSSRTTLRIVTRLLYYVYRHGEDIEKGYAALTLGKALNWRLFEHSRRHGQLAWIKEPSRDIARSLVWFRRAVRCGNVSAAIALYEHYLCGTGVLANEDKARYWKNRAQELIERKSLSPFVMRGRMENVESRKCMIQKDFESAKGQLFQAESENSVREAMSELLKVANEGYAPAITLWCEEVLDTGQKASFAMAKIFLRDAIRQGHPAALALAGGCLLTGGRGVRQNIKLARKLLERAVQLDNAYALALQCRCALAGWGEPKNLSKAKRLWSEAEKKAMAQGDGQCLYELFLLGNAITDIDSFPLLRPAAEAGDVRACFEIGRRYRRGLDVPDDREEAKRWLQKAAFRHHPTAQYELAKLLAIGEKAHAVHWFEKAMLAGIARAGIELGILRLTRNPGILQNWQEAERLFRRFCPLNPDIIPTYYIRIVSHFQRKKHFQTKPAAKQSERDQRFLDWMREYHLAQATHLSLDKKVWNDFEKQLQELKTEISKAEFGWQADDEELRQTSGKTFIKWARWFSSSASKTFRLKAPKNDFQEIRSRCYWRAVQTLLKQKDLTADEKKSINYWTSKGLAPYRFLQQKSTDPISAPDFIREAAFFCCQNINNLQALGLSFNTIMIGHEVAALCFNDKKALTWLIENNAGGFLQKAVDAKIPLALRLEADRISSPSYIFPSLRTVVAKLLLEAAEGGDAEAQCRQGETLLKNKIPEDWRHRACEWFLKAANQGHERATVHLGLLFAEEKPMEAIRWLKKVAKNAEADASLRTSARCELGKLYLQLQQPADAADHLRTAAQNGNRAAMRLLALEPCLRGPLSDEEIQQWCLSLIKQENTDNPEDKGPRGQLLTRLGRLEKDKHKRAEWFRQAAEAGDGPGTYEWARCLLFDGKLQEADTWFQEARKRCSENHRDLAAQASSWHNCLFSIISYSIPPEHVEKMRKMLLPTDSQS
jgi:hypothetical protein